MKSLKIEQKNEFEKHFKTTFSVISKQKSVIKTVKVKPKKKPSFQEEFLKYLNVLIGLIKLIHLINF